jgi:hypothetical protein
MIKKLLTINLILVLVFQPLAVVFAGSGSLDDQITTSNSSTPVMNCDHMNTPDCPGTELCSNLGHTGFDVKNLPSFSIVETVSSGPSHSIQVYKNASFPLTETAPPLRPPRIS